jgi:hypothetical protein
VTDVLLVIDSQSVRGWEGGLDLGRALQKPENVRQRVTGYFGTCVFRKSLPTQLINGTRVDLNVKLPNEKALSKHLDHVGALMMCR